MPTVHPSHTALRAGRARVRESLREVVVVSLGILIAFWIDASWDGRQERAETDRLMSAVADELVLNASALERSSARHGVAAQAGLQILNLTGPEADSVAAAAAVSLVANFWVSPRTDLSERALTTALESGRLGSISAVELREDLGALPRQYSRLDALEGEISDVMRQHIFPQMWSHVPQMNLEIEGGLGTAALREEFKAAVPAQSRFSPDLRRLLRDIAFENAVVERTTQLMMARDRASGLAADLRAYAVELQAWPGR